MKNLLPACLWHGAEVFLDSRTLRPGGRIVDFQRNDKIKKKIKRRLPAPAGRLLFFIAFC